MFTSTANTSKTQTLAESLYKDHHRRLLAIATRHSLTQDDAEEALHDTFLLFLNHFNPKSCAPPLAWLTLTLKRRCWATHRRHKLINNNHTYHHRYTEPRQPDDIVNTTNETHTLKAAFQTLKPQEQRALSLLALGYTYQEITRITGWTYTKVNRCITEGRQTLRQKTKEGAKNTKPNLYTT